jgi:hypothetical protein
VTSSTLSNSFVFRSFRWVNALFPPCSIAAAPCQCRAGQPHNTRQQRAPPSPLGPYAHSAAAAERPQQRLVLYCRLVSSRVSIAEEGKR